MAHTVSVTPILDGSKRVCLHVVILSDGVSGELTNYELADPTDYGLSAVPGFTLEHIKYDLPGFSGSLKFEYLTSDTPLWTMSNNPAEFCFKYVGGLKDRSNPLDGTGKLLLSTQGFGDAGDFGSMVITLRKD